MSTYGVSALIIPRLRAGQGPPFELRRTTFKQYHCASTQSGEPSVLATSITVIFSRPSWKSELLSLVKGSTGFYESAEQREKAIYEELDKGRTILNEKLGANTVRHICFPWGIAGKVALKALRKTGYETAFSDRLLGVRAVRAGDNPFRLMRLENRFIFCLPGVRRRTFFWLSRSGLNTA